MNAHIASIAYKPADIERKPPDRFARVSVDRATLVAGAGILDDIKGRIEGRELNIMLAETMEQLRADGFRCNPGELGEQLVIAGLPAGDAVPGQKFCLGDTAIIELLELRTPCSRLGHIQGKPLREARDRLGFMAKVLAGGEIAVGDGVWVKQ